MCGGQTRRESVTIGRVKIRESLDIGTKRGRWVWLGGFVALLAVVGAAGSHDGPHDSFVHDHYNQWRAECEDVATVEAEASLVYVVGGNHWVDRVNDCMVDKAVDQSP